jgi:hypothetical protein
MIVLYLPMIVCVAGLLCYALATNPKVAEMGRLAFFAGMLAFLLDTAPRLIR